MRKYSSDQSFHTACVLVGMVIVLAIGGCPPPQTDDITGDFTPGGNTGNQLPNGGGNNVGPQPGGGGGGGTLAIADIPDAVISEGSSYSGPTPQLSSGSGPVIWSRVSGPPEMTISPETGVVQWGAAYAGQHGIQIQASGAAGTATEAWTLTVVPGADIPISRGTGGAAANGGSSLPAVSGNGRFVAFASTASNLVAGDNNGVQDIFLFDRDTGVTVRSSAAGGADANGASAVQLDQVLGPEPNGPAISADGRYVAFSSEASNLVAGDTNGQADVFVFDRETGTTARVSVSSSGGQLVGASARPALTGDGRYVVFESDSGAPVGNDNNQKRDIFMRDLVSGTNELISVSPQGGQFAFNSHAASISADGRFVVFRTLLQDQHGNGDLFVRDRQAGTTTRLSSAVGAYIGGRISGDGNFVAFLSNAQGLVPQTIRFDAFLLERATGAVRLVSRSTDGLSGGDKHTESVAISHDGAYVAFHTSSTNLASSDQDRPKHDVFVYNRLTDRVKLVSRDHEGLLANGDSEHPSMSGDGRIVVFQSDADNLVPADPNTAVDIFVEEYTP